MRQGLNRKRREENDLFPEVCHSPGGRMSSHLHLQMVCVTSKSKDTHLLLFSEEIASTNPWDFRRWKVAITAIS